MLCDSYDNRASACLTSFNDGGQYGEAEIAYGMNNGIIDYIGISSGGWQGSPNYIGVIRNVPGTRGQLRCFANEFQNCTAPANTVFMPEGVPYLIPNLPVVSLQTELASENSDGSPKAPIAASMVTTYTVGIDNPYYNAQPFGVESMSGQCSQSLENNQYSETLIVYVKGVPFGGNIGTQDAIMIDGLGFPRNHIERFFYVQGLGRVREGTASWDSNTGYYDLSQPVQRQNIYHNMVEQLSSSTITLQGVMCPQGSAIPLF